MAKILLRNHFELRNLLHSVVATQEFAITEDMSDAPLADAIDATQGCRVGTVNLYRELHDALRLSAEAIARRKDDIAIISLFVITVSPLSLIEICYHSTTEAIS